MGAVDQRRVIGVAVDQGDRQDPHERAVAVVALAGRPASAAGVPRSIALSAAVS